MENAILCGVKPSEFWEMTPHELNLTVEAFNEKYKRDVTLAYYTGLFSQVEKPKNLYEEIMSKLDHKKHEMTDEELLEAGVRIFSGFM